MTTGLIEIGQAQLAGVAGVSPAGLHHGLGDERLLRHDALVDLAASLPRRCIEHHRGKGLPDVLPGNRSPHLPDDPREVAANIETNGCWMVFWNVEQLSSYALLMDRIIDAALAGSDKQAGWARRREGFIFLSAPNSITPVHLDPEHNLLLQVRGTKEVAVGPFGDAESGQSELERIMGGGCRNIGALPPDAARFDLRPGRGVYIPPLVPHWVRNGRELSVSFSVTFRSAESERHERVHRFNHHARGLGLYQPSPPGVHLGRDIAKASLVGLSTWAAGRVRDRLRPSLDPTRYWPDGTRR